MYYIYKTGDARHLMIQYNGNREMYNKKLRQICGFPSKANVTLENTYDEGSNRCAFYVKYTREGTWDTYLLSEKDMKHIFGCHYSEHIH